MKEIRGDWNEKHLKESSFKQEMVRACTKTGHKKTAWVGQAEDSGRQKGEGQGSDGKTAWNETWEGQQPWMGGLCRRVGSMEGIYKSVTILLFHNI